MTLVVRDIELVLMEHRLAVRQSEWGQETELKSEGDIDRQRAFGLV